MDLRANAGEQREAFEREVSELSARIRALRAEGLTPKQIRAALPQASQWAVNAALNRDAAARSAHPGLRARAKDDLRDRARALRLEGLTYKQIRLELGGLSNSTLSVWLRDLPSPEPDKVAQAHHMHRVRSAETAARRDRVKAEARSQIGRLTDRELFLLGVGLYWAEGTKDKAYERRERVVFVNSDPGMIRLYCAWLDLLGVETGRRTYRLSIHESADLGLAEEYWRDVVGDPVLAFHRPMLKRHKPETNRRNTGSDYHGCLVVSVLRSAELYRRIEGWWGGITQAA